MPTRCKSLTYYEKSYLGKDRQHACNNNVSSKEVSCMNADKRRQAIIIGIAVVLYMAYLDVASSSGRSLNKAR